MKNLALLFLLTILSVNYSWSQQNDDLDINNEVEYIESIYESPQRIIPITNTSVRFAEKADTYLKWEPVEDGSTYTVEYKANDKTSKWQLIEAATNEVLIKSLPLDTDFIWKVKTILSDGTVVSSLGSIFSTFAQSEPIQLSDPLYNNLTAWFKKGENQIPFCDFLSDLDLHIHEKLAFLQAYSFENAPMTEGSSSRKLSNWYPRTYTGSDCLGFGEEKDLKKNCNCKILSRGSNLPHPAESVDGPNQKVIPKVDQDIAHGSGDKTYYDLFQAGAAKYVALRQNENSGGMSYAMSNMQGADNSQTVTAAASELKFFLGCVKNGGFSTNLPRGCDCERPLKIKYEYTTNLYVKAEKKNCWFSKGAAAQAEDMAFVVAFNEETGDLNVLDAGHALLSRRCSSSWNPDFWVNVLDVVQPVLEYWADSQSSTDDDNVTVPTDGQIGEFIDGLQVLIGTPFSNREGFCETLHDEEVLVSGDDQLLLYPNQPIRISMFSSYYARTRGYGCYRAEASIASDYYLVGAVESNQDIKDEECCSDKFANYILGSLSTPSNGDVHNDAVNSLSGRMSQVAFFLSSYGDWEGLDIVPNTGLPNLKGEFGLLKGPSCDKVQDDKQFGGEGLENNEEKLISLYPTVSTNSVVIDFSKASTSFNNLIVYNAQGKEFYTLDAIAKNSHKVDLDISNFPSGKYWVRLMYNGQPETLSFIKL